MALGIACAHLLGGLGRRGGNISVDLSLVVLLYNTNFLNKLKFNDFLKLKTENNSLIVQIFFNIHSPPTFRSLSKRKRGLCWSIYINIISLCTPDRIMQRALAVATTTGQ